MRRASQYANAEFLEKHRLAAIDYSVDFANELASGVALSGNPTVTVLELVSGGFTDVSSEFGITGQGTSGTKSVFRLAAATTGQQDEDGEYYVRVSQGTDNTQTLISIHRLHVSEFADTTAP